MPSAGAAPTRADAQHGAAIAIANFRHSARTNHHPMPTAGRELRPHRVRVHPWQAEGEHDGGRDQQVDVPDQHLVDHRQDEDREGPRPRPGQPQRDARQQRRPQHEVDLVRQQRERRHQLARTPASRGTRCARRRSRCTGGRGRCPSRRGRRCPRTATAGCPGRRSRTPSAGPRRGSARRAAAADSGGRARRCGPARSTSARRRGRAPPASPRASGHGTNQPANIRVLTRNSSTVDATGQPTRPSQLPRFARIQ